MKEIDGTVITACTCQPDSHSHHELLELFVSPKDHVRLKDEYEDTVVQYFDEIRCSHQSKVRCALTNSESSQDYPGYSENQCRLLLSAFAVLQERAEDIDFERYNEPCLLTPLGHVYTKKYSSARIAVLPVEKGKPPAVVVEAIHQKHKSITYHCSRLECKKIGSRMCMHKKHLQQCFQDSQSEDQDDGAQTTTDGKEERPSKKSTGTHEIDPETHKLKKTCLSKSRIPEELGKQQKEKIYRCISGVIREHANGKPKITWIQ